MFNRITQPSIYLCLAFLPHGARLSLNFVKGTNEVGEGDGRLHPSGVGTGFGHLELRSKETTRTRLLELAPFP